MNAWLQAMGLDGWKPLLATLLLPPVPWLAMIVAGALAMRHRRRWGGALLSLGVAAIWACSTDAGGDALTRVLLDPPPPLRDPRGLAQAPGAGPGVVLVLGGGRSAAAQYPERTLAPLAIERLRYGVWLSRQTGWPLAFTGGLSPGSDGGPTEGAIATRIARDEFRHPLAWAEVTSRDTHENAIYSVRLLGESKVTRVLLVTHDMHMPRALGHFRRERDRAGLSFELIPAPVGIIDKHERWRFGDFMPSPTGIARSRYALREWLGLLAQA